MASKTTHILLVVSLSVNLLIIGAAIGVFLNPKPGPRFPGHLSGVLNEIAPQLTDDQRAQIRKQLRESRRDGRALHRQMRDQQSRMVAAIRQEPFDETAVRAAFNQSREAREQVQAHMHAQMINILGSLPAEQRVQFMERLLKPSMRPRKLGDGHVSDTEKTKAPRTENWNTPTGTPQ